MRPEALRWAIEALSGWAQQVSHQRAAHLWTYLPLKLAGAQPGQPMAYAESDDFKFFDEYFRFGNESHPYFDPLKRTFRIESHPHSNVATARTGTFVGSWRAAAWDKTTLTLASDVADVFRTKALTKGGVYRSIPALAIAVWLQKSTSHSRSPGDLLSRLERDLHLTATERALFDWGVPDPFADDWLEGSLADEDVRRVCLALAVNGDVVDESDIAIGPSTTDAVARVVQAMTDFGMSSIVALAGVPGTGKTFVAGLAAEAFASSPAHIREIQFSPATSYEEFIEGPRLHDQGVVYEMGAFLDWNESARLKPKEDFVLLIEEFTRADLPRVLGELMTYVEYRDRKFYSIYDRTTPRRVAENLTILVTFNPVDRSAVQLDDALVRRLRIISFPPSIPMLDEMLASNGVEPDVRAKLSTLFEACLDLGKDDFADLMPFGHGVFADVHGEEDLHPLWQERLRFLLRRPGGQRHPWTETIRDHFPWADDPNYRLEDGAGIDNAP